MGVDRVTTQNLRVVQTDVERGLHPGRGRGSGRRRRLDSVRDAVKRALPKDAPQPGKFRVRAQAAAPPPQDARRRTEP